MAATTLDRTAAEPRKPGPRHAAPPAEALLVTGDDRLAEQIGPIAAAARLPLHRAEDPAAAETHWQHAPLVIVGADTARACIERGLPPRPGLIFCATGSWLEAEPGDSSMIWPLVFELKAEHVISLPEGTEWLLDRLTRAGRDTTEAPIVAAVAGHGGAGSSTLALATATAAAHRGERTVLIDLDLTGGGIDTAAGLAAQPGWRWPSLATGSGPLQPERLLAGLPQRGNLHLVGPDPRNPVVVTPEALDRILHAAEAAADLVVVDLPRHRTAASARAAAAARTVAVTLGPSHRSREAARSVIAAYRAHTAHLGTVDRGRTRRRDPDPDGGIGLPKWGSLPTDDRLPERLRQGRLPKAAARRLHALTAELTRPRTRGGDTAPADRDPAGAAR
ncbi:septum site-determining protein Ssd [Glycomyces xiaoerkulensis]|uniref:septum site-determining protein Ssd n=1 Tax=Glycomyces xiaoerkulensis TaxID=2038139 RepID=UPI000C25DA06|nr:septum site-determining protein Ssd [Glycomyces xiaoerkulensis]